VAYIYRREVPGGSAQGIPVELAKILDRKSPDINLEPNDILYIPDAKGKRVTLGTIEKVLGVSATMSAAAIYATTR
jgi:hypothetical protein